MYRVEKRIGNGYHCCCMKDYDADPEIVDSFDLAVKEAVEGYRKSNGYLDYEILEVNVFDCDGDKRLVANGTLCFSGGRGSYAVQAWKYWIDDGQRLYRGEIPIKGINDGETYDQASARVAIDDTEKKIKDLKAEIDAKQRAIDSYEQKIVRLKLSGSL